MVREHAAIVSAAWRALIADHGLEISEENMALDEDSLLDYVRSCLSTDDGDDAPISKEDVEALVEVLVEYVAELSRLPRGALARWLADLSEQLRAAPDLSAPPPSPYPERQAPAPSSTSSSTSTASTSSAASKPSAASSRDREVAALTEVFPGTSERCLRRCLAETDWDVAAASELLLEGLAGLDIDAAAPEEESQDAEVEETNEEEKAKLRAVILGQYQYVDLKEDQRTYRPPPPKYDSTRVRTRFLNGASVDTRGQKYLEVKDPAKQEGPQPAFLRALKKYKKH